MKKIGKQLYIFLFANFILFSCNQSSQRELYKETLNNPKIFHEAMSKLTDVMVHDIFSPPVASRIYAYSCIASYEIISQSNPEKFYSLSGQIQDLKPLAIKPEEQVNIQLASLYSFLEVGKSLIFSENMIETYQDEVLKKLELNGLDNQVKKASLDFAKKVAAHILDWANGDMYKQTRTFPQYTIQTQENFWKPTPPDYMQGIEPHWNKIRTLILDSSNQYIPEPPLTFSLQKETAFYKELYEVYEIGKNLNAEQKEIAKFWDCNPYVSHHRGHAMFATKKLSPGGHWIGIVGLASRKKNLPFDETIEVYTKTAITLFDAFISCWDEKWRSILVRPETLISEHIDEKWVPLLQTPPFPEYTSGHSVISRAAAVMLTDYFGDSFSFKDSTELTYGLPLREFESFIQASDEAAISRLYGGIHYRMACEEGVVQGEKVGNFVVQNLNTRQKREEKNTQITANAQQ